MGARRYIQRLSAVPVELAQAGSNGLALLDSIREIMAHSLVGGQHPVGDREY